MAANDVFRYYYGERRDINTNLKQIHNFIFSTLGDVSNKPVSLVRYTREDAALLTRFFREYKHAMKNPDVRMSDTVASICMSELFGDIQVPVLNFDLAGKDDGKSIEFERELLKLLDKTGSSNLGQESGYATLKINGTFDFNGKFNINKNFDEISKFIEEQTSKTFIKQLGKDFKKSIKTELQAPNKYNVWLKIGEARFGKTDVSNVSNDTSLVDVISISGSPTEELKRVIDLLANANFSVKSYLRERAVSLGSTIPVKAITAITDYLEHEMADPMPAKVANMFFLAHPNRNDPKVKGNKDEVYDHYEHLKKIYELSGLGLNYGDLKEAKENNVDFLLSNTLENDDIVVYSVNDLIESYRSSKYKSYKYNMLKESMGRS